MRFAFSPKNTAPRFPSHIEKHAMCALQIKSVRFVKSAVAANQLLRDPLPRIAFAGRSNVGKSSLINTLLERKNMARASSTPAARAK